MHYTEGNTKVSCLLFNEHMVRALLQGIKDQTRRVIHKKVLAKHFEVIRVGDEEACISWRGKMYSPLGDTGDLIWVKETWAKLPEPQRAIYRAEEKVNCTWRPAIYMPRWASRITLKIRDVRVMRLQDITDKDAEDEGIGFAPEPTTPYGVPDMPETWRGTAVEAYRALWESINGPGSWEKNPWVYAARFHVFKQNIDDYLREQVAL